MHSSGAILKFNFKFAHNSHTLIRGNLFRRQCLSWRQAKLYSFLLKLTNWSRAWVICLPNEFMNAKGRASSIYWLDPSIRLDVNWHILHSLQINYWFLWLPRIVLIQSLGKQTKVKSFNHSQIVLLPTIWTTSCEFGAEYLQLKLVKFIFSWIECSVEQAVAIKTDICDIRSWNERANCQSKQ